VSRRAGDAGDAATKLADDAEAPGTRERLLRAAAEVIQNGGWGAASVGAIAERAGVAAGTLYRHFQSKAELFVEVFRAVSDREVDAMRGAETGAPGMAERFDAVVATYAGRALRNRRLAWALVYEPVDPSVDAERLAYRRNYCAGMAILIRRGIDAGVIPAQDADLAAAAVVGVIAETLVGPLSPVTHDTVDEAAIVDAIVGFCRRVIGLPPRDAAPRRVTPSARRSASGRRGRPRP
jgi:AcrR family transcriptional regulator